MIVFASGCATIDPFQDSDPDTLAEAASGITAFNRPGRAARSMIRNLGIKGLLGVVLLIAGVGLIAYESPIVAAGIAMVVAGLGLVAQGLVSSMLRSFGMF